MKRVYVIAQLVSRINLRSYINLYNFLFYSFGRMPPRSIKFLCLLRRKISFLKFYRNNARNNVRNYAAAFLDIVPIEKRQTFLPVPRVRHLIKRCKYEFLPHAPSALRSFCLTQQPFRDVPTEFEIVFLCLPHINLCYEKRVDFKEVLCYTEYTKKLFTQRYWK